MIVVHLYSTKEEALLASELIILSIRGHSNGATKYYSDPIECVNGWGIVKDEITSKFLGNETVTEIKSIELNDL